VKPGYLTSHIPALIAYVHFLILVCFMMLSPGRAGEPMPALTREQASGFARLALKGLGTEYPNKPEHVMAGPDDVKGPRALHPAFYGSYDWHSSVHGHWMLARLLRRFPDLPETTEIRAVLNGHLTAENLKAEADYFGRKESRPFERPYGWAWLLKLAEEFHGWDDPDARRWSRDLRPLADVVVARYLEFFPKQTYPIRTGVHPNTFFSPSLVEADLMRRMLPPSEFRAWFARFLPGAARGEPKGLFTPATVTDRTDPQLVHLDGLNLSRAWCMRSVAEALPADDPAGLVLTSSAARHAGSALVHVASGDYAGEHWLASFAVYLLTTRPAD
jgi:hypothetical protein